MQDNTHILGALAHLAESGELTRETFDELMEMQQEGWTPPAVEKPAAPAVRPQRPSLKTARQSLGQLNFEQP